jgi:Protein of unknown function (DUF402)
VSAVAIRELWRGRVWLARAWHVVEETQELVVLANRPGSETRVPVDGSGTRLRVPRDDWSLASGRWESWTLRLARPGEPFSTLLFFDECRELLSWYVNLEQPLRRTPLGWDTLDWKLDLVAMPDGTTRLKDEAELDDAARAGVVDARKVRALAARIAADPPWPTGWEDRAPGGELEPARLPHGWERV